MKTPACPARPPGGAQNHVDSMDTTVGSGGPRWSECPHVPLPLPWSWLLAWTEGSIQMWVGIQGRWGGHRLLFVILLD